MSRSKIAPGFPDMARQMLMQGQFPKTRVHVLFLCSPPTSPAKTRLEDKGGALGLLVTTVIVCQHYIQQMICAKCRGTAIEVVDSRVSRWCVVISRLKRSGSFQHVVTYEKIEEGQCRESPVFAERSRQTEITRLLRVSKRAAW